MKNKSVRSDNNTGLVLQKPPSLVPNIKKTLRVSDED